MTEQEQQNALIKSYSELEAVLMVMLYHPGVSLAQWAEKLDWFSGKGITAKPQKQRVQRVMRSLKAEGMVRKKMGKYSLTKTGRTEAERLRKAVADAHAVAARLKAHGFEVTLRENLDADQLQKTLKQFFAIKGRDPDARLFLWYAGHGHTVDGEGYLVPADAPRANDPTFLVSALPLRDFGSLVRLARSKHVLSVFDACFAGTVFEARGTAPTAAITLKTTKPVRQFITSGDAGQQVRDDGSCAELSAPPSSTPRPPGRP